MNTIKLSTISKISSRNYSTKPLRELPDPIKRLSKIMMTTPNATLEPTLNESGIRLSVDIVEEILQKFSNAGVCGVREHNGVFWSFAELTEHFWALLDHVQGQHGWPCLLTRPVLAGTGGRVVLDICDYSGGTAARALQHGPCCHTRLPVSADGSA